MYLTQIDLETENYGEMRGHTYLVKFSKIRIYVKPALSNEGLNLRYLHTPEINLTRLGGGLTF
jgi:hypothetical protein